MIVELPEVTVEALRSTETEASAPFSVSIHQRSPSETTLEAPVFLRDTFRGLPGVWMNDRGHFALGERLVVRGMGWRSPFGVRGVQVLLDGVPLTLPDGQAFLDIADPLFVRQAELTRGPSSLFWGNGSGGVLFLNTFPTDDFPTAQFRAGVGSFGLQQGASEVVLGAPDDRLGEWRFALSDMRRDGYRKNSDGRFTRGLVSGRVAISDRTRLQIVGAIVDQDASNPGSLTAEEVETDPNQANPLFGEFGAGKQSTQAQLGVGVTHDAESVVLDGTLYGGFRDLKNPLPFAVIEFDRIYGGGRTSAQGTVGPVEWNVGLDAGFQRDDRLNFDTDFATLEPTDEVVLDQRETVISSSVFGYARLPITDRLRATIGSRADRIDFELNDRYLDDGVDDSGERVFSAFSPGIGLSYDIGSGLLFANYSTAFETPTTTELVNRPGEVGGFNTELSPQWTRGIEIGTRGIWAATQLEYDVSLYHLWVDDRLVAFDFPDSDRTYFRNVGANTHQGVEIALQWQARPWLSFQGSYTGNRSVFEDESLDGNRVPGVPEQRFFAEATVETSSVWGRVSLDSVSDYFANNENTAVSEGHTLVDVRAGLRDLGFDEIDIRPYAEVSNLFDTQYNGSVSINAGDNFFEPGPGRAYKAGVTLTL
jgi:iron complex outermembrane receptor protein